MKKSGARLAKQAFIGLILLAMGACQGAAPTAPPVVATLVETPRTTQTSIEPTLTSTVRPNASQALQPSLTPNAGQPTTLSTPTSAYSQLFPNSISPDNSKEVIELARWGKGIPRQIDYSPDGSQFALFTSLGLYIYDAQTLGQLRFFPAQTTRDSAGLSPDWETLAWGHGDTVELKRISDNTALGTLKTDQGTVTGIEFSPDGSQIALHVLPPGEEVYTDLVELRQASDGTLLRSWDLQGTGWVFSPDWSYLASWRSMTGMHLWQLPTGKELPLPGQDFMPAAAAFSPDSKTLAVASQAEGTVRLWRLPERNELRKLQGVTKGEAGLVFSPDGKSLAGISQEGGLSIWQVEDGTLMKTLSSGPASGEPLAFSPDGAVLTARSEEGLAFWSVSDGSLIRTLKGHLGAVQQAVLSKDGGTIAALVGGGPEQSSQLRLWRPSQQSPFYTSESLPALCLAISPDGARLALGRWDGGVEIRQASDGQILHTLQGGPEQVQSVTYSPDGSLLASTSMEEIHLWKTGDGSPVRTIPVSGGWVTAAAFSPDGGMLAALSNDGALRLWQVSDGSLQKTLSEAEAGGGGPLSFSPDGAILATGTHQAVRLWKLPGGEALKSLPLSATVATGLAFSPDGSLLAVGLSDGDIQFWETSGDEPLHTLAGHTDGITGLAFSSDGQYLLSGGLDGTVRLWGLSGAR